MTEYSTITRRRSAKNNSTNDSANLQSTTTNQPDDMSHSTPPSRIPIKSPARSTNSRPVGGMAVAYSPLRSPGSPNTSNTSINDSFIAENKKDNYSKKLMELKNAMDLLKTPPAIPQSTHVSYTPMKSSSLATNHHPTSPFASAIDPIEISMGSSSDTETTTGNDTSLLDAYREDDSFYTTHNNTKNPNNFGNFANTSHIYSSPQNSVTSSPYISSEELKKRLEATKEAFQRSLEAQKRRLRTSLPHSELDSSFSTCGYDSDLSVDSLRDTKDQLERIRKEMADIIESDLEDVDLIRKREASDNLLAVKKESFTVSIFKYLLIFTVTFLAFTYLFISYAPSLYTAIQSFLSSFDKETFLEKLEETLNFLLQE